MAFVDEVTVFARAGRGGDGSASILREPYKPRGGPDGGDGGRGGDVVFQVDPGVRDLSGLADRPHQRAASGKPGRGRNRSGANGTDLIVHVPDGTRVEDERGLLADLVGTGSRAVVARGGRGGRGNAALAGPRNRVPRSAEAGERGEDKRLSVELRIVADIGLVGLPNAGKSTLLSRLTAARPKIADYPFTTITPNLGVAGDDERFVVADIPGLVEGAHEGRGLGDRFLRHVSRCRVLVLVVDLSAPDPSADLATVRAELQAYDPELAARTALIVATKADLLEDPSATSAALGPDALVVSGTTGEGLAVLRERLSELAGRAGAEEERQPYVVLRPAREPFYVAREGDRFRVVGRSVERWVTETDFDDDAAVAGLQKRLVKAGVERQLTAAGAIRGDEIVIGEKTFDFLPEEEARRP